MRFILAFFLLFALAPLQTYAQFNDSLEDYDGHKKKKKKKVNDRVDDYDEFILQNGFFLDGLIQGVSIKILSSSPFVGDNLQGFGLGFRLGSKWYFGEGATYRPGIGATWGRMNLMLGRSSTSSRLIPYFAIAPANVGFINAFSFGGELGLEANLNFGFNAIIDVPYDGFAIGYLINPTIKFRYRALSVGLDLTFMMGDYIGSDRQASNILFGLTIGGKF